MRIGAQRNAATGFFREAHETQVQILPVRVTIYLHGFIEFGGKIKNARPFGGEPEPKIVNTATGMAEDMNGRVAQGGEVALGLVVFLP